MNEPFLSAEKARMVIWTTLIYHCNPGILFFQHPQWTAPKLPKASPVAWFYQKSTMHIDIKGICSGIKIKRCKVKLVVYFYLQLIEPACKRLSSSNALKNFYCAVVFPGFDGYDTLHQQKTFPILTTGYVVGCEEAGGEFIGVNLKKCPGDEPGHFRRYLQTWLVIGT